MMTDIEQEKADSVRVDSRNGNGAGGNGHTSLVVKLRPPARNGATVGEAQPLVLLPGSHDESAQEAVDVSARGWRGWLRTLKIARILGTLSLYLFLDSYDIRANFNRRITE